MTRFGFVIITCAATFFIALTSVFHPAPKLLWNASASAPLGLYRIEPERDPPPGALVAVTPPQRLARWMAERPYLGEGVPLLKHVAGKAGQRICRLGDSVSVDRRPVAVRCAGNGRARSGGISGGTRCGLCRGRAGDRRGPARQPRI